MDSQNVQIKNTFLEVFETEDDSGLLRSFSDQSHSRNPIAGKQPALVTIAPIPEEGSDSLSDRTTSVPGLNSEELLSLRTISRPEHTGMAASTHWVASIPTPFHNGRTFEPPPFHNGRTFEPPPFRNGRTFEPSAFHAGGSFEPLPAINDSRWHEESASMGVLEDGRKSFTKLEFEGRLSMVTDSRVFREGVQRFLVLVETGPLSVADGFGFVFSDSLPCKKNIQKINSVFINRRGKICSRIHNEMEILNDRSIGSIEVGSLIELVVDLNRLESTFTLYSPPKGIDSATLSILVRDDRSFLNWLVGTWTCSLEKLVAQTDKAGHFCAVLKNKFTKLRFL